VDEDRNYDEIQGDSKEQVGSSGYTYPYDSAVIPEKGRKGHNNKVRDPATTSIEKVCINSTCIPYSYSDCCYFRLIIFIGK
jgi:hypothetical protein